MDTTTLNKILEDAKKIMEAPSSCPEIKVAADNFIKAFGTEGQDEALKALIAEADADLIPIDGLLWFLGTEKAKDVFGDGLADMITLTEKRKADGEKYCNCPACEACKDILDITK